MIRSRKVATTITSTKLVVRKLFMISTKIALVENKQNLSIK